VSLRVLQSRSTAFYELKYKRFGVKHKFQNTRKLKTLTDKATILMAAYGGLI
jgi:hypothetical protein